MGEKHTRACMVCRGWFVTEVMADGTYSQGHYFGRSPMGFAANVSALAPNKHISELEIWECNDCYRDVSGGEAAAD
jgi:hypothetical protein